MFSSVMVECELKYEPGIGFFMRTEQESEWEVTGGEIQSLYTERALSLLGHYPSTWCAIVTPCLQEVNSLTEEEEKQDLLCHIEQAREQTPGWREDLRPALILQTPVPNA